MSVLSKLLQWLNNLPATVKALIGVISAVIAFVLLLRANFELGVVVLVAVGVVAALSYLAHVALAKNKSGVGFSPRATGGYKYPQYRPWAITGLCIIILTCAFLFILKPTRYYILAALKGTWVAPRADILIAQFDARLASKQFEIPKRIRANLERQLQKYDLKGVEVATLSAPVTSLQEAKTAAEQSGSKIVVWGWYDDLGVTINLYTPTTLPTRDDALKLKEIAWFPGGDSSPDISLKIRERLPEDVTFLSLFIIGTLNYQNNEYQKGYQAFDAAMGNLPKEIGLENESLLHFFYARNLEATGSQDTERTICEYSKAIELNPKFAAPYNNLGILITKLRIAHQEQYGEVVWVDDAPTDPPPLTFPGNSKECLNKIYHDDIDYKGEDFFEQGGEDFFFNRALILQPDSAILQYNKLASSWKENSGNALNGNAVSGELADILQKDPSIPGAHVMMGIIAFDEGEEFSWHADEEGEELTQEADETDSHPDVMRLAQTLNTGNLMDERRFQIALREFSAASSLLPTSAELHINIGMVYMRKGMVTQARAEFEKALSLAPNSAEAHLTLADVAIRQGQPDLALQHLDAIPFDKDNDRNVLSIVAILRSRIYFESGKTEAAIEALRDILSPEKKRYCCVDTSLIHYLLGLLYVSSSNVSAAAHEWKECDVINLEKASLDPEWWSATRDSAYHDNFTVELSWIDLLTFCSSSGRDVSKWGVTSQCLPRDLNQRLKKVFDIMQDRIPYRVFYRQKAIFGALFCPYVYTYDADKALWLFDTTIIYGLSRKELEISQLRSLKRFDGRLIVREVEPEVSHLDQISILAVDHFGQLHVLRPQLKALRSSDGNYLTLRQGDEVLLNFAGFEHIKGARHFRVEAKGYYTPSN